jgi:hypothetical protein
MLSFEILSILFMNEILELFISSADYTFQLLTVSQKSFLLEM